MADSTSTTTRLCDKDSIGGDYHKLPTCTITGLSSQALAADAGSEASSSSTEEGIKRFYMIEDGRQTDSTLKCHVLDLKNDTQTTLTISPASGVEHEAIHGGFSVVAVGTTIYLIGGVCDTTRCSLHERYSPLPEVMYFDTLNPEEGYKVAAPMNSGRYGPVVVYTNGLIYVFGGLADKDEGEFEGAVGEFFDPQTNVWGILPGRLDHYPVPAYIQGPFVHADGTESILLQSLLKKDTLYGYSRVKKDWGVFVTSSDGCRGATLADCWNQGAVVGHVIYVVFRVVGKHFLYGFDLYQKQWFPVKLIDIDEIQIVLKTTAVFSTGRDKLCLVWHYLASTLRVKIGCLELNLNPSYSKSGELLNITATKAFQRNFEVEWGLYKTCYVAL